MTDVGNPGMFGLQGPAIDRKFEPVALYKIAHTLVINPTTSIVFDAIPQDFQTLWILGVARVTTAAEFGIMAMRFNQDASADYDQTAVDQFNNTVSGGGSAGQTSATLARVLGASATANRGSHVEALIPNYASSYFQKVFMNKGGYIDGSVAASENIYSMYGWRQIAPITRIDFIETGGANFVPGTEISLYGLM